MPGKKPIRMGVAALACCGALAGLGVSSALGNGSAAQRSQGEHAAKARRPLAASPGLVNKGPINPKTWKYGPEDGPPPGCTWLKCPISQTWNPVKRKLMEGKDIFGGTVTTTDPADYCTLANSGQYDFTWTELQHAPATFESVANEFAACPHAAAVPGARVAALPDSRWEIQHAEDEGAMVIVVPQVDTVKEAKQAVKWTYFPPIGQRSNGGGQAFDDSFWGSEPGGYRNSFNQNVVLIVMIESVKGAMNAPQIAKVRGVDGLFAASSDLGSFSGYVEGQPDYEKLVKAVHDAALGAGKWLCGPSKWGPGANGENRPGFNCFQGGEQN